MRGDLGEDIEVSNKKELKLKLYDSIDDNKKIIDTREDDKYW